MAGSAGVVEKDCHGEIHPLTRRLTARRKKRRCLHCGQEFDSESPGHRFCSWCKNYLHHNDGDDPHEQQVRIGRAGRVDSAGLQLVAGAVTEDTFSDGNFPEPELDESVPWEVVLVV